jgi:hypothetical protein
MTQQQKPSERRPTLEQFAQFSQSDWLGASCNLNGIDFTGYQAVVSARKDQLMAAEIFLGWRGIREDQLDDTPWIAIGKSFPEDDGLFLPKAVTLSPIQLWRIARATNYHPINCWRSLLTDIELFAPERRHPILVSNNAIAEVWNLGDDEVRTVYVEQNETDNLSRALFHPEMIKRIRCASEHVINVGQEAMFTVYRNQARFQTEHEYLFSMVYGGDTYSTDPTGTWRAILNRSQWVTHLDLCHKHKISPPSIETLARLAENDPTVRQGLEAVMRNEWEIFLANKEEIIPGAFKGSVIDFGPGGAGPGYYKAIVVHSHPVIDPDGMVWPSSADINFLNDLRQSGVDGRLESFAPHERLIYNPVAIIVQPSDPGNRTIHGLILRGLDSGKVNGTFSAPSDEELVASYQNVGVVETMSKIGIGAITFSITGSRYSGSLRKDVKTFGK